MLSIYVIHTFFPHKRARQDIAILLPVCIISAIGIIDMGRIRKLAVYLLLLCGIFQFLLLSLPENIFAAKLGLRNGYLLISKSLYVKSPKKEDWRVAETLQSLGNQRARVGFLCDTEEINGLAFQTYAIKAELPFTIDRFSDVSFYSAARDLSFLKTMYKDYDFVITLSDWAPFKRFLGEFIPLDDREQAMVNQFNDHVEKNHFTLFKSFHLPDSSDVLVYKHRKTFEKKPLDTMLKEDNDHDGISNEKDNCLNEPNGPEGGVCTGGYSGELCTNNFECGADGFCSMNQEDVDQDGFGDVCDFCKRNGNKDSDQDGICDAEDNCYYVFNPDQQDSSGNGVGDACIPSHIENHWLEAEQADVIVNPLEVAYDEKASEGSYIYSQNGTINKYTPSFILAAYRVHITHPGLYILLGRVKASDARDDSFFVQIDDDLNYLWELEKYNYWHWAEVHTRDGDGPVLFDLTAGVHVIKVKLREDGTKLDKLLLTNNITFNPTEQMNPDAVIAQHKKKLASNPNDVKAHHNLAATYLAKGMLDQAISEYKKILALNPNYGKSRANLGLAYYQQGRLEEAIEEYEKALTINPTSGEVHYNLSIVYYAKNNYKLALLHCDRAQELGFEVSSQLLAALKPYR